MTRFSRTTVACALALTAPAPAVVIFDNFGPDDTYRTDIGWAVTDGAPSGIDRDHGDDFMVLGGDYRLVSIKLAISHESGTNRAVVTLHRNNQGVPGVVLETFVVSDLGPFGQANPPVELVSVEQPLLEDGRRYWIVVSGASDSALAWNWNDTEDIGRHVFREDLGQWVILPGATSGTYAVDAEDDDETVCPDEDKDGMIGFSDLLIVLTCWGPYGEMTCPPLYKASDTNQDCIITFDELLGLLTAWGPCPEGSRAPDASASEP